MRPEPQRVPVRKYKSYDVLERRVENILKKSGNSVRLRFSMYEGSCLKGPVRAFDFNNVFATGRCVFYSAESGEKKQSLPINDPTWLDVLVIANHFAGLDHIFLEAVDQQKDGRFKFFFGS